MRDLKSRTDHIAAARALYIPHRTKNISVALELYLNSDLLKGVEVPLRISGRDRPKTWIDDLGRPDCPICKNSLLLRAVSTPAGRSNLRGWQSCWECLDCGYERYSLISIQDRLNAFHSKPLHRS